MKNVGIFIFDEVEVLDFAGPFEVFSVTNELNEYSLMNVFTISKEGNMIKAVNGLLVQPTFSVHNHPPIDIFVLPGGSGSKRLLNDGNLLSWITKTFDSSLISFSVCSGARFFASLGLLENKRYTTHHEVVQDIQKLSPLAVLEENARFVDEGKMLTSAGITAGIDLSLYIVEKLFGEGVKNRTVRYMEYGEWKNV